jgi:hypothetical protein
MRVKLDSPGLNDAASNFNRFGCCGINAMRASASPWISGSRFSHRELPAASLLATP